MAKIDALDFGKYVENNRQRLSNALDGFNINKQGNSLDGLVSSAISNLKTPEIDTTLGDYDNTPDPELLWLKDYYDNDPLLEKNGGTYTACIYILHSKKALDDNSYRQIYLNSKAINYINNEIVTYSSVGYYYKDTDFITINNISYILARHYTEGIPVLKEEWANLYSKGVSEYPNNSLQINGTTFRSVDYMLVDALYVETGSSIPNNAPYFKQIYLTKNTAIMGEIAAGTPVAFDNFNSDFKYLSLIFSEINELHIIGVDRGTDGIRMYGISRLIPCTIPTNIFLYGVDSLSNAITKCGITNFNKEFIIYNINTKTTTSMLSNLYGWFGVVLPKITYKGVFVGTLNNKTISAIIDNYDNVRYSTIFLLSSDSPALTQLSLLSVADNNITKSVNLGQAMNLEYLYLPKDFKSSAGVIIKSPRLSIDNWILLLNNFYDASSSSAISLTIDTFIKYLFDNNYVILDNNIYIKANSLTEGAITISEAFANKNWTLSI